ncbi:hypothetical protein CDV31_010381 [Fusarium ambrosium]|uniref:Uncharacterized protein n=1 Tax=Fusarium ambrosium TaxID=131363 RepID=A0A428TP68_9HYPO|nr:hypothetical protein CDV31_010381 [Fusarium ambrosium]
MYRPSDSQKGGTPDATSTSSVSRTLQQFRAQSGGVPIRTETPPRLWQTAVLRAGREAIPTPPTQTRHLNKNHKMYEARSQPSEHEFEQSSSETTNSPQEASPDLSESSPPGGVPLPAPLHIIHAVMEPQEKEKRDIGDTLTMVVSEGQDQAAGIPSSAAQDNERSVELPKFEGQLSPGPFKLPAVIAAVDKWQLNDWKPPIVTELKLSRDPAMDSCDIDTDTGELIKPIKHIRIKTEDRTITHNMGDPEWRRWNMTSEMYISRELARREKLKEEVLGQLKQEEVSQLPEDEPWPDARCTLRPAVPEDCAQIAQIVNLEIQEEGHSQILLPQPVTASDIRAVYDTCLRGLRPFIVAVPSQSEFLDRSKWPKGAEQEYQEFLKFKKAQEPSKPGVVLGFAFVADTRQGFLGHMCPASRLTGQIKLAVHPEHRRKLIGTALLDRILASVTIGHRSLVDFKWECSDPNSMYEYPADRNRRQYARVYVETFFTGEDDPSLVWMTDMLEKFDFKRVGLFKETAKRGTRGGEWLDLVVWELEVRSTEELANY